MASRKRPGLGKGLDALIPQSGGFQPAEPAVAGVTEVAVAQIVPNPRQPRLHFDPDELAELAASIAEHGVIQPLIVTKGDSHNEYVLIAGERRLQASKKAGLKMVPVIVREATEQGRLELALIENVQRADLSPLETAEAYRQLAEEFNLSHEAIGKRVGKSRVAVTNTLRLLALPPKVQQAILDGLISEGHGRALLALPTVQAQLAALQTVVNQNLSVRQTEALVRKLTGEKPVSKPKPGPNAEVKALEERLMQQFGTKVAVKHGKKGGSITIHYFSNEELDSLLNHLLDE